MTELNETKNVTMEAKPLENEAKKVLINDTTKKVAVAGAAGLVSGFMTVVGGVVAQKVFDKLEVRKAKKMLKKAESKKEATEVGESASTEEVED